MKNAAKPVGAVLVLVDGPFDAGFTPSGDDGGPEWTVSWMDEDFEEIETVGRTGSYEAARKWGQQLADDHRVEYAIEATPW